MNVAKRKNSDIIGSEITYGFITKKNRIDLRMKKSHSNDVFVIGGGTTQTRVRPYGVTQRRRNDRTLQVNGKGFRLSIRRRGYSLQSRGTVQYNGNRFKVIGVHSYGKHIIIRDGEKKMDINTKKVKLLKYGKGV